MAILRIEHPVPDFESWKQAFDSDPIGRGQAGVRRYRVLRSLDDANYVMVDLELDTRNEAEQPRGALRELWGRVQPEGLIGSQVARIADVIESREY